MSETLSVVMARPVAAWWRPVFGWAVVLTLALLLVPGDVLLQAKQWVASWLPYARQIDDADVTKHADKLAHFGLFAVLGWLASHIWWGVPRWRVVMGALVGLGLGTELLQHFIPGRGASGADLVADGLGLMAGALAWRHSVGRTC